MIETSRGKTLKESMGNSSTRADAATVILAMQENTVDHINLPLAPPTPSALVPSATDISKSFFVVHNVLETQSVEIDHVGVSYQFGHFLRRYLHEGLEE